MVVVTAALVTALAAFPTSATTVANTFELDGNPQEGTAVGDDWQTLFNGGGSQIASSDVPVVDGADFAGGDRTWFKGGGSKDTRDTTLWQHSDTDVAPDKDEIVNAAVAAYLVPDQPGPGGDADSDDDLVITFHSDRFSNDGDAAIGFWFFKAKTTLTATGFTPAHTNGDTFVVSDFNEGEGINTIRVFEWLNGALVEKTLPGSGPLDCQESGHNPFVCATENRTDQDDVASVWPYTPKANVGTPNKYPDFTFLEGGINISAVIPDSDECFASFLAETRSSTSPTAQLKDFALGDFPICLPATTLSATPTPANPEIAIAGDSVTVTFTETNTGNIALTNVHVTEDSALCTLTPTSVSLAPGASQAFTCSVATPSTAQVITITGTGHGTDASGRDVTFCTDPTTPPTNTICDQNERAQAKIVTIVPGTDLAVSASPTTAKSGDVVTFTVDESNDGTAPTGFESSLALEDVAVDSNNADCDTELADNSGAPDSGDADSDGKLDSTETWRWTCTVTISGSDDLTVQFTGTGTALKGTSHQRVVTFCADVNNPPAGTLCDQEERASATVDVINPGTKLNITADARITYTFVESNEGDVALDPPGATKASIISVATGQQCNVSAPEYVSGDTDNDGKLDVTEDWTFTCVGSLSGPTADTGSTDSTLDGRGHGEDSTGDDNTWCADVSTPPTDVDCDQRERDRVKVTIENLAQG